MVLGKDSWASVPGHSSRTVLFLWYYRILKSEWGKQLFLIFDCESWGKLSIAQRCKCSLHGTHWILAWIPGSACHREDSLLVASETLQIPVVTSGAKLPSPGKAGTKLTLTEVRLSRRVKDVVFWAAVKERGLLLPPRVCPDGRARDRPELLWNFPRPRQLARGLWGAEGPGCSGSEHWLGLSAAFSVSPGLCVGI